LYYLLFANDTLISYDYRSLAVVIYYPILYKFEIENRNTIPVLVYN